MPEQPQERGEDPHTESGSGPWRAGFNEYLLIGVVVLILAGAALSFTLYALPVPHLQLAELQPSIRVARVNDFPPGSSRVVTWGENAVLVIRTGETSYAALQGTSPLDGCVLDWNNDAMQVRSPCGDLIYDLYGNVVRGLTTIPLKRFTVFLREDAVYVTGA